MAKLTKEEVVTIHALRQTGETNQGIGSRLGITEGAVRYHLRRQAQAASDGRSKISLIQELQLTEVVDHWHADQLERLPKGRSPNLHSLWTFQLGARSNLGKYEGSLDGGIVYFDSLKQTSRCRENGLEKLGRH